MGLGAIKARIGQALRQDGAAQVRTAGQGGLSRVQGTKAPDAAHRPSMGATTVGTAADERALARLSTGARGSPPRGAISLFSTPRPGGGGPATVPRDWADKVGRYATGEKRSLISPGPNEGRVRELRDRIGQADVMDDAGGATVLSRALSEGLGAPPLPYPGAGGREAALRQAVLVARSAAAGVHEPARLLSAVMALPEGERRLLLQADRLAGGHLAAKVDGTPPSAEHDGFSDEVASDAVASNVEARLDAGDPSGRASGAYDGFRRTLADLGMPASARAAFDRHVAFQMRIGTLAAPDTAADGWGRDFTLDLLDRFAALEDLPRAALADLLGRLPKSDLTAVVARAATRQMEGDVHILRAARSVLSRPGNAMGAEAPALAELMGKLERRAVDPAVVEKALKDGADVATALKDATSAMGERCRAEILPKVSGQIEAARSIVRDRLDALKGRGGGDVDREREALEKVRGELASVTVDEASVGRLVDRFGFDSALSITTPSRPQGTALNAFTDAVAYARQTACHLHALSDVQHLRSGLQTFVPVLPTAGKVLENFHWLQSTVDDLASVARTIREGEKSSTGAPFSLSRNPIVIFDQSKPEIFAKNADYIGRLRAQHGDLGLNIVHVSLADLNGMIQGSPIQKLFDTNKAVDATGGISDAPLGNPGYGGARNVAYMLGPVVADAAHDGRDVASIKPDSVASLVKGQAMGKTAPTVFMGDDTDYVRPGGMFARVGLNTTFGGLNHLISSPRDGRNTTGVAPGSVMPAKGMADLDVLALRAFPAAKLGDRAGMPGMGCVSGTPRFCFDIPVGGEEKHHNAIHSMVTDHFSHLRHLSGDRMKAIDEQVRDYLNYAVGTKLYQDSGGPLVAEIWNDTALKARKHLAPAFETLGDVLANVASTASRRSGQEKMLTRLEGFTKGLSDPTDGAFSLKNGIALKAMDDMLANAGTASAEERRQMSAIKATYEATLAQSDAIVSFNGHFTKALQDHFEKTVPKPASGGPGISAALASAAAGDPQALRSAFDAAQAAASAQHGNAVTDGQIFKNYMLIFESLHLGGFSRRAEALLAA